MNLFTRNARSCSDSFACHHFAFLFLFMHFGSPLRCSLSFRQPIPSAAYPFGSLSLRHHSRRSHLCALWMRPIHHLHKRISFHANLSVAAAASTMTLNLRLMRLWREDEQFRISTPLFGVLLVWMDLESTAQRPSRIVERAQSASRHGISLSRGS
jgi:hypothetical protein